MERGCVCSGQCTVLVYALDARLVHFGVEDGHGNEDQDYDEDDIGGDCGGEFLQGDFVVDGAVGDDAGHAGGVGEEDNSKELLCSTDEAEATCLVRVWGEDLQVEFAHATEELSPKK